MTLSDDYVPQEPVLMCRYVVVVQRHRRMPTTTPAIETSAGRYPLPIWMIGMAGQPPEIAHHTPNSAAPGTTPA